MGILVGGGGGKKKKRRPKKKKKKKTGEGKGDGEKQENWGVS